MEKRKINKVKVGIVIAIVVILLMEITGFSRYIYNSAKDKYLTSKAFYFTSNLLEESNLNKSYQYINWGGTDTYVLDLELNSFKNELLRMTDDLEYELACSTTSSKVTCGIDSETGDTTDTRTIYQSNDNIDSVKIYIVPKTGVTITQGETIPIKIVAKTTNPYAKELSATFNFEIKAAGSSYTIEDEAYQNYLTLNLKNTLITESEITLNLDTTKLRLDTNDEVYLKGTVILDGSNYINEIVFTMPPESSKNIKFYKVDVSRDYTASTCGITITKGE